MSLYMSDRQCYFGRKPETPEVLARWMVEYHERSDACDILGEEERSWRRLTDDEGYDRRYVQKRAYNAEYPVWQTHTCQNPADPQWDSTTITRGLRGELVVTMSRMRSDGSYEIQSASELHGIETITTQVLVRRRI
jgi:hypothetical protein